MASRQPPSSSSNNNEAPLCHCKQPACKRTVRKEGPNQGRLFWGCGQWSSSTEKGCRFFEWVPEEEKEQESTTTTGHPVKLLTFNVAGFKPHRFAPPEFDPQQTLAEKIDQFQPDILALQELKNPSFSHPGYYSIGTAQSHCGYVALLVKNGFLNKDDDDEEENQENNLLTRVPILWTVDDMMAVEPPMVVGSMTLPNQKQLFVISCHLEPYAEGAAIRQAQLQALTQSLPPNAMAILAGDMNVRKKEDGIMENLHWKDAWKEAGSIRRHEFTWNSKTNQYHEGAFQFTCRFDRVYLRNSPGVASFKLIANGAIPNDELGECYYLSDHFGILTTVLI
jgi:endonuclease/exonuclease/phosphatase family metal-dependent hydrolase